jgi:DNA-binding NtrC family response regulator
MSVVMIVEDERGLREGLARALEKAGHTPVTAAGIGEARTALATGRVDCMLLDIRLKDGDGLSLLREVRRSAARDVPVIIATAYGDSERAIQAMRDGAFEYLTKPFDLPQLLATVERALKQAVIARAPREPAPTARGPLVGTSAAMLAVWKVIGKAAATASAVLIVGEPGTGKELVARAIHDYSARAKEPFTLVTANAITPAALAGRGTLFIDDVDAADAATHTKLLRALQEGDAPNKARHPGARIVSATHVPVRPGQPGATMREELYYRLAVLEIEIPPLRSRKSDIPLLVAHALADSPARAVSEEAMAQLVGYTWPGNVRELFHVIRRASEMSGGEVIDLVDLPEAVRAPQNPSATTDPYEALPLREALAALERRMVLRALAASGGNRAEAARRLGIARQQLYAKMEEHGIATRAERTTPS